MKLTLFFTIDSVEFTPGVIDGTTSLGGSESACLGLARALRLRGHEVHIFTTKLSKDAPSVDHAGVFWHPAGALQKWTVMRDVDVLVALRMPTPLTRVPAKLKVLWNQDLMINDDVKNGVMGCSWAFDKIVYVSEYHRRQWEAFEAAFTPLGYVTRNGFDPAHVPADVTKRPNRIIHISRPERGIAPLLAMWPKLKALRPDAELAYCRYDSMYDAGGWGQICQAYDRQAAAVNEQVGGILPLGELGKAALYQAIAEAAVMWYPGVVDFAETSCIAALEAQANGTPFVGSFKGALPETVPSGILVDGNALTDEAYHQASVAAVVDLLDGCAKNGFRYRQLARAGREHVKPYTYAAIAAEWEAWLLDLFQTRYASDRRAVMLRALHDDDHVTAKVIATELQDKGTIADCDHVIAGRDQSPESYHQYAMSPIDEIQFAPPRLNWLVEAMTGQKHILDLACGNGAFALTLAQADPERRVTGVDYSPGNIDAARAAAEQLGLSDRVTFICAPAWDMDRQQPSDWLQEYALFNSRSFDGIWVGEFLEHVANAKGLIDAAEGFAQPGANVCWSCPSGPFTELLNRSTPLKRGHVHHLRAADLDALFGAKDGLTILTLSLSQTPTGADVGHWLIRYAASGAPTGTRPLERRMLLRPYRTVTLGILVDHTLDVRRALDGLWPLVDEIIIGDTGLSERERLALVEEFPRKLTIIPIGPVPALPGGFSEARNRTLQAATSDWFLWVDSDEQLQGGMDLRKYLDGHTFKGYAIRQNHLHLDQLMTWDTPVRLFRTGLGIDFYGCVHEQPQLGDCNTDITPCLQCNDVQIAHTGYLDEAVRRHKAIHRNFSLVVRDQETFPDRELGKLIVLREYSNLALWSREAAGGRLTDEAKAHYANIVGIFEERFADPAHRFHTLARTFYESALQATNSAMEIELAIAGRMGGLENNHAKPTRFWARTKDQIEAGLQHRIKAAMKPMEPAPLDVAPVAGQPWVAAAPAKEPVEAEVPA